MDDAEQVVYFRNRAATERELARLAPAPYIARIHVQMAERYETLISEPHERNVLKIVEEVTRAPL